MSDKTGQNLVSKKNITVSDLSEVMERQKQEPEKSPEQILREMGFPNSNSHINLNNAFASLTAVAKKLESKIKQAEASSDKIGPILVSKKNITVSDLSEAMERQKQEPDKSPGQILCEMGFLQSNSYINLNNALTSLTAVTKKLESKIKQDESSPDRIGQILVSKKIITEADLSKAMERQRL
jgi:formyltetrahydrofolate hydrolase